jgi:hypothetical protein
MSAAEFPGYCRIGRFGKLPSQCHRDNAGMAELRFPTAANDLFCGDAEFLGDSRNYGFDGMSRRRHQRLSPTVYSFQSESAMFRGVILKDLWVDNRIQTALSVLSSPVPHNLFPLAPTFTYGLLETFFDIGMFVIGAFD